MGSGKVAKRNPFGQSMFISDLFGRGTFKSSGVYKNVESSYQFRRLLVVNIDARRFSGIDRDAAFCRCRVVCKLVHVFGQQRRGAQTFVSATVGIVMRPHKPFVNQSVGPVDKSARPTVWDVCYSGGGQHFQFASAKV